MAMPQEFHFDAYVSFTLAVLLLFVGKACTRRFELLRRYSIPEPVVGGLVCIAVFSALYLAFGLHRSGERPCHRVHGPVIGQAPCATGAR